MVCSAYELFRFFSSPEQRDHTQMKHCAALGTGAECLHRNPRRGLPSGSSCFLVEIVHIITITLTDSYTGNSTGHKTQPRPPNCGEKRKHPASCVCRGYLKADQQPREESGSCHKQPQRMVRSESEQLRTQLSYSCSSSPAFAAPIMVIGSIFAFV